MFDTLITLLPWRTVSSVLSKTLSLYGLYILGGLFIVAGIVLYAPAKQDLVVIDEAQAISSVSSSVNSQLVLVDIAGAVQKPGVYRLSSQAIVADAIIVAGGFATDADIDTIHSSLNLSESLHDRQKVYIPTTKKLNEQSKNTNSQSISRTISINSASQQELETLPGIGSVRAAKILDNRPYLDLYELVENGVLAESMYEKLKEEISL